MDNLNWLQSQRATITTYQGSELLPFQRWFKFKEAFSPHLVRSIIESFPVTPNTVLDCCSGSGTTGVVSQSLGVRPWLIETNPFLADLARAKLADYSQIDLARETAKLVRRIMGTQVSMRQLRSRLPPTFIEPGVDERWLFSKKSIREIERIRLCVERAPLPIVRRLFKIALASLMIPCSNVRMDGKGRRYRQNWQDHPIDATQILPRFLNNIRDMIEDIYRFSAYASNRTAVLQGDSRRIMADFSEPIDAAIFSPPYPNSFDYTDIYNIELWLLGYIKNYSDNRELRLSTIRSHVQVEWASPSSLPTGNLKRTISRLERKRDELWNPKLPQMVHAYFEDLLGLLLNVKRCLTKRGHIVLVVGDSSYAGVKIPSADILKEYAAGIGLRVESCESVRIMRSSMQQTRGKKALDEWLVRFTSRD